MSDKISAVVAAIGAELKLKADAADLATVATSGDYDDLSGLPALGTAAATDANAYATAAQGSKADTAVQPGALATVATSGQYSDLTGLPVLGTAAATNATAYATAAQGALADSAVQPGDLAAVATSGSYTSLTDKPTIPDISGKQNISEKGAANGYASLDGAGKVPVTQLPASLMEYRGTWNAATNSPTLADGVGDVGDVWRVGTAGTRDLGSGAISFGLGDYAIYDGTVWQWSGTTDAVSSVAGKTGDVTLAKGDVGLDNVDNTADSAKSVASAAKLTTARTINGVSFNGTANITVADSTKEPAVAGGTAAQYYRGDKTWATLNAAAVAGLGTAATTASSAYATAAQGVLADSAVQPGDLAAVATTGAYSSLSGTPSIPDALTDLDTTVTGAQLNADHSKLAGIASGAEVNVQSDWNASSGDSAILNKPTIPTALSQLSGTLTVGSGGTGSTSASAARTALGVAYGTSAGTVCQGNDTRLADARTPLAHTHSASDVNSGTLSSARMPTGYVEGSTNGSVASKKLWTGTAAQYAAIGTKDSNTVYIVT
ncbi:hypothetical protein PP713_14140 [Mycobacterium sp. CSUR Q5927]|nr:hypothetical protein [Mycobacterium sp. CSUR Q5927]